MIATCDAPFVDAPRARARHPSGARIVIVRSTDSRTVAVVRAVDIDVVRARDVDAVRARGAIALGFETINRPIARGNAKGIRHRARERD